MQRVQKNKIIKDLESKMVLLVGPRQVGKTYLAKSLVTERPNAVYLNYDSLTDRKIILAQAWLPSSSLLVLDELHKMPDWKNFLKGVYDTKPDTMQLLVTGSARLDIYTKLGDSLAGRFYAHHLLPLSIAEIVQLNMTMDTDRLIDRSGFPEPYLAEDELAAKRWRMQYINSLISTDVFEIDNIQSVKAFRMVFELLRTKVGSPVSLKTIAEDVQISPHTVKKYIEILEALYIVFRVVPYTKNIARSLLKEPKIYFFDTGLVEGDHGAKLENFVAISLLKHCYAKRDYAAEPYQLQYLRTKDGMKVDFAIVNDDVVEKIIEVKYRDKALSKSLVYFQKKYELNAVQIVKELAKPYMQDTVAIVKVKDFLQELIL